MTGVPDLVLRAVGPRAWLVEVAGAAEALELAQWVREHGPADGIEPVEVVPAARTLLLDGLVVERDRLAAWLARWAPTHRFPRGPRVEVDVRFDGPDLDRVAVHWQVSTREVVARVTATEFTAAFTGFAPGFSYLAGLRADWAVPRLSSPRARVAPGSVGLADTWAGIYPTASPGGWLLLGHTEAVLWDATRPSPALLPPGTRVRFREAP